jgi:hypothetical protein
VFSVPGGCTLLKKKTKISSYTVLYKEIQKGAVAKSYMTNGLLIYMYKYLRISSYVRKHSLASFAAEGVEGRRNDVTRVR